MRRRPRHVLEQGDHGGVPGNDLRLHQRTRLGQRRRALASIQRIQAVQLWRQCGDQNVICCAFLDETAHHHQRLVDDEVRGRDAGGPVRLDPRAGFPKYAAEFAQPGQVPFDAAGVHDHVCIGQELRQVDRDTRDLVDPVTTMREGGLSQQIV